MYTNYMSNTLTKKGNIMDSQLFEMAKIIIDGVEYIPASEATLTPSVKQIVVLQRGWVVVGDVHDDGEEITITSAFVIRVWGTTKGLGELVDGPTSSTKLDAAGDVRALKLAVVLRMEVNAAKW